MASLGSANPEEMQVVLIGVYHRLADSHDSRKELLASSLLVAIHGAWWHNAPEIFPGIVGECIAAL